MTTPRPGVRDIRIPTIDLSAEADRRVIVAQGTADTYQGHPTTLLMPDGKTVFCVWTLNHGGPCGPLKRSDDGGMTWSELLPVPENWRTVRNCPTLFRLVDPNGVVRLFVFAGQGPGGTMHQSYSEDNGNTWTPMVSNGLVCVMPFCTIVPIAQGKRLLAMTNIRRPNDTTEKLSNVVARSISSDGGMTWSAWQIVADIPGCKIGEPKLVRSPDGSQLLCLLRENNRSLNSWMMVSDHGGTAWSEPRQLPASISGDRHMAAYAPDGRLVVCFRDTADRSPTRNHFVAWVGTYEAILARREGHYRVKLLHSYAGGDCGYPGLECLPDGTFLATTYIKYEKGPEKHSVVCVRFKIGELDQRVRAGTHFLSLAKDYAQPLAAPNLAQDASVEASSEFTKAPFPAANATDGSLAVSGRWVSDAGPLHWLTLRWPTEEAISRVRVWTGYPERSELRVSDYTIQYWDGAEWQVAATVRDNDKAGPEEYNDLQFAPVLTDRLKMEITRTPTNHARVFEVEVYGSGQGGQGPVAISGEPQLMVDDCMIRHRYGVTRNVHACTKLPSPVLASEMPWEQDKDDQRVYLYGSVFRDPESGRLRMWYNRMGRLLYATSDDGIRWVRPKLGRVQWQGSRDNNLLPLSLHSPSLIDDPFDPDRGKRYKLLGSMGGKGYGVAYSPDGLDWHMYEKNPVLNYSDTCTLAQDQQAGEYLAFHKIHRAHRGHGRRLVFLATSKDMQTWSHPRLALAPDEIDDAQTMAEGGKWSQFYNMSVFPYGGQYLGLVTHFRFSGKPPQTGPGQSPDDGPIDVQLVHSRDGRHWGRLCERQPVIPNGPYAYDAGCILGTANQPVMVGDEMWIYYTGITTTHGGFLPEKRIAIARASWRLDGFVSLDAGQEAGVVETVTLNPEGDRLLVNANAANGDLRVEVLGADGLPLPGYTVDDCIPMQADSVRHAMRWEQHDQLPPASPIALRFHLRNAGLYSYRIKRGGPEL